MGSSPEFGAGGQRGAGEAGGERWADELVTKLRGSTRRDEAGRRLALQPLHPYHFRELTAPQRRGVYEWAAPGSW